MRGSRWRLVGIIVALPILLFLFAMLYQQGMAHLEGEERSFSSSLEWAAETITTTGYGKDAQWTHPAMIALVIVAQFAGVFLVVLIIPFVLIPYLEERFEGRLLGVLPRARGAVLIYKDGPAVASLQQELERARVPVVIFEDDANAARRLRSRGRTVFYADLEHEDPDLTRASELRAVVLNGEDHRNAVMALALRQAGFQGTMIALIENPHRRNPMLLAGVTATFTPNHILAAAVAAQASIKINPHVAGVQQLGKHLQVSQLRVHRDSSLAGKSLIDGAIRARTGATVVGVWREGELEVPPDPRRPLPPGTILVAAGSRDSMVRLGELAHPMKSDGHFIVAGYGEIGSKVAQLLRDAGEEVFSIDIQALDGVDLVGDALDPQVLEAAGLRKARGVLLCLPSDGAMLFAAALVHDLAPQAALIAAVRRTSNVRRVERAGADFALSVSTVAGQLLAAQILGEEAVSLEASLKVVRVQPGVLAGTNPITERVREKTGCSVIAVERRDDVIVELDESFRLRDDDTVYVCGEAHHVERYYDTIKGSRAG